MVRNARSGTPPAAPSHLGGEPDVAVDPVCGMPVDRSRAVPVSIDGALVYFCSRGCRDEYLSARNHDEAAAAADAIRHLLSTPKALRSVFQPIVSAASGAVAGYEALARFPPRSRRSPEDWFALASSSGRQDELEAGALASALRVIARVPPPAGAFVSVNVSPLLLETPRVAAVLDEATGLARLLVLELTERERVTDYAALLRTLAPYRQRGIRIAVDDAGAGYSSLRHITELLPEFIKLDAALIRGIAHDAGRRALVAAMATFAHEIGATLIAEGVEARDELDVAVRADPRILVQGFAVGPPAEPWASVEHLRGSAGTPSG